MRLGARTWREVHGAGRSLVAVPLGSCEQHGPHLPLDTDTRIAVALADGLAAARPDVVVAPAVAYGASGEHAGFAGTLSIGLDALEPPCSSSWSARPTPSPASCSSTVTAATPRRSTRAVRHRPPTRAGAVLAWSPTAAAAGRDADAHAGRTETSLLLALAPSIVHLDHAEAGATAPLAELLPALRAGGVRSVAPNGVLGDPSGRQRRRGRRRAARRSPTISWPPSSGGRRRR